MATYPTCISPSYTRGHGRSPLMERAPTDVSSQIGSILLVEIQSHDSGRQILRSSTHWTSLAVCYNHENTIACTSLVFPVSKTRRPSSPPTTHLRPGGLAPIPPEIAAPLLLLLLQLFHLARFYPVDMDLDLPGVPTFAHDPFPDFGFDLV